MRKIIIGTLAAIALAPINVAISAPRAFHPHRENTPAEDFIVKGEDLASKNDFDSAVINFRRAKDAATTECEAGFADAGEKAGLAAKAKFQEMGRSHPHVGQASFSEFRRVYLEEHETMGRDCFV